MILKEADDRSADLTELRRLKDASRTSFHAAIQKQIDNIYAGIAGERGAAHFLKREFGTSENMAILHDLRIGVAGDYAQIDHLVIHRIQATAWVLETKSYSGRLSCDEHGDWTVWRSGKPISIPSPVNQARRQCETLRLLLENNGIKAIQRILPVVLISPTSSVDRRRLPADAHVVKSDNFGAWWRKEADAIGFGTALGIVGRHLLSGMSRADLVAVGEQLVAAHVPTTYDWRAILRLPVAEASTHTETQPSRSRTPPPFADDARQIVSIAHGEIQITRIPDGRYALRNEKSEALIEIVKHACRGRAQWSPRYRNWLFGEGELSAILAAIAADGGPPRSN